MPRSGRQRTGRERTPRAPGNPGVSGAPDPVAPVDPATCHHSSRTRLPHLLCANVRLSCLPRSASEAPPCRGENRHDGMRGALECNSPLAGSAVSASCRLYYVPGTTSAQVPPSIDIGSTSEPWPNQSPQPETEFSYFVLVLAPGTPPSQLVSV